MAPTVTTWSEALMASAVSALALALAAIPKVIGFLVILVIGWLIASALASAVAAILRAIRFNDLAARSGVSEFVRDLGVQTDASGLLANVAKWFVRLIVLVVAFDALGLPAVSSVLQQLLLWLPNVVVAIVVLVVGGILSGALAGIVRGATADADIGSPDVFAALARFAVWAFAIIIAANQIGVASTLVNTLFTGTVAAFALAFGLAFGLGGRDTAGQIVANWYKTSQRARPNLDASADVAALQPHDGAMPDGADAHAGFEPSRTRVRG